FQVGLVATLEIGVTAALAAAAANWFILRRAGHRRTGHQPAPVEHAVPLPAQARLMTTHAGIIDETDDAGGHRIYLNPWAADEQDADERDGDIQFGLIEDDQDNALSPAVLQDADLAADRVGELVVARLLSGHRVRAVHAVVVRVQLRPEHRQDQ